MFNAREAPSVLNFEKKYKPELKGSFPKVRLLSVKN